MTTQEIPVARIKPNDWNPNEMTEAEFAELVAEVKHLGRLPKPVVVRPNGKAFVIVDGEHGWRAAKEADLVEVPCEVIDADNFEARRQTFKRNQHGSHNPVLLGRMFRQMMEQRDLSQRALAKKIDVSEGTVRNALLYADAADVRNCYAHPPRARKAGRSEPFPRISRFLSPGRVAISRAVPSFRGTCGQGLPGHACRVGFA